MGLARVAVSLAAGFALVVLARSARAEPSASIVIVADRDDDDANGIADGDEQRLAPAARADLVALDRTLIGAVLRPLVGADRVRVVAEGRPVAWSSPMPPGAMLQGLAPGAAVIVAQRAGGPERAIAVDVVGVGMRDGTHAWVDMTRDHASLARTPPVRVEGGPDARYDDPDALRVVVEVPEEHAAHEPWTDVEVTSVGATGAAIDTIRVAVDPASCEPSDRGVVCTASAPVRFVIDEVDAAHPLVRDRSVRAQVGGAIVVQRGGRKLQAIRVLGPRKTPAGAIGRLRATLRPFVFRVARGAGPAIGGTDAGAMAVFKSEISLASAIWGQCGLTFGSPSQMEVVVADPPPSHLLAIGDDLGVPASGGEIRFRIEKREIVVPTVAGETPDRASRDVAAAIEKAGFVAIVSENARIAPAANASVDISVRRRDGKLVALERSDSGAPLTSDATLAAQIGSVDLADGLQHFGDMDSVAGTLEERTLLKSIDDGDPRTVEVVVVPLFTGGGRIGESFIASDRSSVRNVVLLDRAGIRARRSSLTLAHELGHVLMDVPGHPDDYGEDTPTLLMDSDGSDASPFGPRRLTVDECARVLRQAGPRARTPLLVDWPVGPLHIEEPPKSRAP